MRRVILLLTVMAVTLVLASGVALAVNKIGTDGPDTLRGTNEADSLLGRVTRPPAEHGMWRDELEKPGTDSGHTIEPRQTAERAVGLPVGNDRLGQSKSDLGQSGELRGGGRFKIHLLTKTERPALPHGAVSLHQGRTRR